MPIGSRCSRPRRCSRSRRRPSLHRLQFDANILHALPRDGVAVPAFRDYLERFGSLDYLYVIVDAPEGTEIGDHDETVEALTTALRQAPEIAHVDAGPRDAGRDWSYFSDRVLLLVTPSQPELLERFQPGGSPRRWPRRASSSACRRPRWRSWCAPIRSACCSRCATGWPARRRG